MMRVCANMRVCAGVHDARVVAALVGSLAVDMCTVGIETKNRDSRRAHCRRRIPKEQGQSKGALSPENSQTEIDSANL